jgi:DNA-directed RNA polymerase subunit RPC12/RpoP
MYRCSGCGAEFDTSITNMLCSKCKKEYGDVSSWPPWLKEIAKTDLEARRSDNVFYDHVSPLFDEVDEDDSQG